MLTVSDTALDEFVSAIVREANPEKVYLFGSRGRGEARRDSDVDILVVVNERFGPENSRWEMLSRLWAIAARLRIPADILLYSAHEVNDWRDGGNNVIEKAIREGKPLYART